MCLFIFECVSLDLFVVICGSKNRTKLCRIAVPSFHNLHCANGENHCSTANFTRSRSLDGFSIARRIKIRTMHRVIILLGIFCIGHPFPRCHAASAHIRVHEHKASGIERTKDGAFSPRDSDHYVNGEHHQEFDHEAILGSVKEAEEFDKLPIDESRKRLKILLTKMDLNGDQYIKRDELKAWILRSFSMLSSEESRDRLDDADSNEDKRVSWEEILHDTYGTDPEDLAIDQKLVSDDKETFLAADIDGDGYLDVEEFKSYTHPEESPRMFPFLLKQTLAEKDLDGDGYVSFSEFIGTQARDQNKEWLIAEKDKFDNDYDKDRDGKLDSSELLSWLVPSNEDLAVDEVDHLFAASDDDHDDQLSFDEILEHHDVFVGSEATDYGDYLHEIERFTDEL